MCDHFYSLKNCFLENYREHFFKKNEGEVIMFSDPNGIYILFIFATVSFFFILPLLISGGACDVGIGLVKDVVVGVFLVGGLVITMTDQNFLIPFLE
jgi:hypothetical protein